MFKKLLKSNLANTFFIADLLIFVCVLIAVILTGCADKNNAQGESNAKNSLNLLQDTQNGNNENHVNDMLDIHDESDYFDEIDITVTDKYETLEIIIDDFYWTLYLYESVALEDYYTLNSSIKFYPISVLTNAITNFISPTLVMEGDTFMDWTIKEIKSHYGNYICFDDGRMYYNGDTMIQFEGEIKVIAKVYYGYIEESIGAKSEEYLFIRPNKEYRELFPEIIFEYGDWVSFWFYNHQLENHKEILELIDYKYGEYEIEMIIKDYYLSRVPTEGSNKAILKDMKILSVVCSYSDGKE